MTWTRFYNFAIDKKELFLAVCPGLKNIPSKDIMARVMAKVDAVEVEKLICDVSNATMKLNSNISPSRLSESGEPEVIAVDGKTVRGAAARCETKSKINVVNVVMGLARLSQRWLSKKRETRSRLFPMFSTSSGLMTY